jgi:hypothetical protein
MNRLGGMKWVGHVGHMGEMGNVSKILVQKPEGMRLLRRSRCKWDDNIKMGRKEWGESVNWIHLSRDMDW